MINKEKKINEISNFIDYHNSLIDRIDYQYKDRKELMKKIEIMQKYLGLIISIGYDYDGLNQVSSLKELIDELVRYAKLGKECNTKEIIYISGNKKYNIINEEIK